jgi:predicted HD phosphohydrolase
MLQTAALALRADAPPPLVAAACCTRLSPGESARFEARPYAMNACQVRRRDDDAKNPDAPAPAFAEFEPLLREHVR